MATQHGSVLVTGSSSGIGRSTAIALAEAGFRVFAGVRKDADGYVLREATPHRRLIPVILDVTEDDQITAAATRIAELTHGAGLAGLVNNAGTALARPIEFVEIEALREQYEINVIGQVAVTQAMLPLLRAGRGRVINIGSAASWTTMPFAGVQCSVKHALRSVNDALRQELKPWSIPVILVEPGVIKTAAVDKLQADLDDALASLGVDGRSLYEESFRAMVASALRHEQHRGAPAHVVARTIITALTARHPRTRYPTGPTARSLITLARLLPNPVLDALRRRILGLPSHTPSTSATR